MAMVLSPSPRLLRPTRAMWAIVFCLLAASAAAFDGRRAADVEVRLVERRDGGLNSSAFPAGHTISGANDPHKASNATATATAKGGEWATSVDPGQHLAKVSLPARLTASDDLR
jgi:hypothetical protein